MWKLKLKQRPMYFHQLIPAESRFIFATAPGPSTISQEVTDNDYTLFRAVLWVPEAPFTQRCNYIIKYYSNNNIEVAFRLVTTIRAAMDPSNLSI